MGRSGATPTEGPPVLLPALLALAAVILFVLAGLNFGGRRFNPAYFGWACAAVVVFWPLLTKMGG